VMILLGNLSKEDLERFDDVGSLTAMVMILLGNYAQTGHFGGPLSYTPANVVLHLAGGKNGGLAYDIRDPKHPLTDKYLLAGGHCAPTNYALWIVLYEAMKKRFEATGDEKYKVDPEIAMLAVDALGFRRSPGAVENLLQDNGLADDPLFDEAKARGIRALMGHCESTDVTTDVNSGPSGIGVANSAGKAMFWDAIKAPEDIKVIALEGEFAFTEGHAQELKTVALAQQVGKRLRLFFSYNNAGIDDALIGKGGVIHEDHAKSYDIAKQFSSYGWNVFELPNGAVYSDLVEVFRKMEEWDANDRRPMVVVAETIKGWWPQAKDGKIRSEAAPDQVVGYKSHPYNMAMNSDYFVALTESFEKRFGVEFEGIRNGKPGDEKARLSQFKRNVDIALSVLDQDGGKFLNWTTDRLLGVAEEFHASRSSDAWQSSVAKFAIENRFADERLKVENLPRDTITVDVKHPDTGKAVQSKIALFQKPGAFLGTRRVISELGKYCNYVTGNRWFTIAADLSGSINLENSHFTGHYDPATNPSGTRLKAGIQECCNAATMAGLVSQTVSGDKGVHAGMWGVTGTYGAFTPLMYTPLRIFSQQNQDSPFKLGVVTVIAGHSGPETAADGRSHFGVFAPQVWNLFPRKQIINLHFWDYNDVAPGYFAAVQLALHRQETGLICIHVARPDFPVADRETFADKDILASAKGCYVIRDFAEGPRHGTVLCQGSSSTVNTVAVLKKLEEAKVNVRVVAVISEDLFREQPEEYQKRILSDSDLLDAMYITTGTKRCPPISNLGPFTEEYSLSSDHDDRWRTGGLEPDVIAEAHLDEQSIFDAISRFANERTQRMERITAAFNALSK